MMKGIMTLDIDIYKRWSNKGYYAVYRVQNILFELLNFGEYYVRVSSSGKGIHIKAKWDNEVIREKYDDYMRFRADKQRSKYGIKTNILFSRKNEKKAGEWYHIRGELDIIRFIEDMFKLEW